MLDERIEPHRVIVCHLEEHLLHDLDIGVLAQVEVVIVLKHNLRATCSRNLHVTVGRARFDLLDVIIDQEDVLHLHKVGLGTPEDRINPAEEDNNVFHS